MKNCLRLRCYGAPILAGAILVGIPIRAKSADVSPDSPITSVPTYIAAAVPNGWRLTRDGWEHTSTWNPGGPSINRLIEDQRNREPAWIRFGFLKLRSIPPLMVAVLQITAIAVITSIAENQRRSARSGKSGERRRGIGNGVSGTPVRFRVIGAIDQARSRSSN